MIVASADPGDQVRGTVGQRARAALVGGLGVVLDHLPAVVVDGACDAAGELWYRAAPGRAAIARGNLGHIVEWLAAEERGSPRARAAASDPAALERLVRAAFRHAVRGYAETLSSAAVARDVRRHLVVDDPEAVDAAFAAGGPAVFATLHFGSMTAVASILGSRSRVPVTAPMETLVDPELQRVMLRARASVGVRIVGGAGGGGGGGGGAPAPPPPARGGGGGPRPPPPGSSPIATSPGAGCASPSSASRRRCRSAQRTWPSTPGCPFTLPPRGARPGTASGAGSSRCRTRRPSCLAGPA